MGDEFIDSLVSAIADFFGNLTRDSTADLMSGPVIDALLGARAADPETREVSPWTSSLTHIAETPVTLDVPENHGIAGIRAHDPEFELSDFLMRVGQMFASYHRALDLGDLAPTRRFVDERFYAQIAPAAEKAGRRAEGPRAFTIKTIRPMTALHEDEFDLVRILITAAVAAQDDLVCEYWEVYRKRGVVTKTDLDLTHCPNCGGPIDGLDPTHCAYCGMRLADPALDWVVRRITAQ